jgi:23S rRNA (cytosine1962-C5)-methyltransferase
MFAPMRALRLEPDADRRLRLGHLWVYANEFDGKLGALGLTPGECVELVSAKSQSLGVAYVNPNVLIAGRLLGTPADGFDAASWLRRRLDSALALRARLGVGEFGRLVYGESDGLPGLVVDRYGPVLSVQCGATTPRAANWKAWRARVRLPGANSVSRCGSRRTRRASASRHFPVRRPVGSTTSATIAPR